MNKLLESEDLYQRIDDPVVTSWVLDRLADARWVAPSRATAAEERLFDEAAIRRILERADTYVLDRMFSELRTDLFRGVASELVECWPGWEGRLVSSTPVFAACLPDRAVELFGDYIDGNPLWHDTDKTMAVCLSLTLLSAESRAPLVRRMVQALEAGVGEAHDEFPIVILLRLGWEYDRPLFHKTVARLITDPGLALFSERIIPLLFEMVAPDSPFFEHIEDLQDGAAVPRFSELSCLFEEGAPLHEFDRPVKAGEELSLCDVLEVVDRCCAGRDSAPLAAARACMAEASGKLSTKAESLWAKFLLAAGLTSWMRSADSISELSFDECVRIVDANVSFVPGYVALLARLQSCSEAEAVGIISDRYHEDTDRGTEHLIQLMGDLQYDAFLPLILEWLDCIDDEFDYTSGLDALVRFGERAERFIIDSWDSLTGAQRVARLEVLERVQSEATVSHLIHCFPELEHRRYLEYWCNAAVAVADSRLVDVLAAELYRNYSEIDYTFCTLCAVLGIEHEDLPAAIEREAVRKQKVEDAETWLTMEDSDVLDIDLCCTECGKTGEYEVTSLFISPIKPDDTPLIGDELTCRACGALDTLTVSEEGQFRLAAELIRLAAVQKSGHEVASPVQLISAKLAGGQVVSTGAAIDHYRRNLEAKPDSLYDHLCLGNCYHSVGRLRQAKHQFRRCLDLDLACPEAAYSLAGILEFEDCETEAYEVLAKTLDHKKHWRFYRLIDSTPEEFTEAYLDFHGMVSPRSLLDSVTYGEPEPRGTHVKVSPNDRCPCGSGKKYKKCCGRVA